MACTHSIGCMVRRCRTVIIPQKLVTPQNLSLSKHLLLSKTCHSERLPFGARNLLVLAAGEQQVPPLRRCVRSGSGRNDNVGMTKMYGYVCTIQLCTYIKVLSITVLPGLCVRREGTSGRSESRVPFAGPETALRATISTATPLRLDSRNKYPCKPLSTLSVFSVTSTQRQQLPGKINDLRGIHFAFEFASPAQWRLEILRFQHHAGDVVVLRSIADEEIDLGHQALEHFGGLDQFSGFDRA